MGGIDVVQMCIYVCVRVCVAHICAKSFPPIPILKYGACHINTHKCVRACVCGHGKPYIVVTKYSHKDVNIPVRCTCGEFFGPHEENSLIIQNDVFLKIFCDE